ncbi:MAG: type II toxin-antitoxin system VapC family toxin [Anaerolineae bacterium]
MTTYYTDNSGIVKRYAEEIGTRWIEALCDVQSGNTIAIAQIGVVEVAAALARKRRDSSISEDEYEGAMRDFIRDAQQQYQVVTTGQEMINLAVELTRRQTLRGYDAVQLASAMILNRTLLTRELPALVFVSADDNLLTVAGNEGLFIENPNWHP